MYFLFCRKNQKLVLQKEIKDWAFEAYLLTDETISWFSLIESLKITFESARSYVCVVLEFFIKRSEKNLQLWKLWEKKSLVTNATIFFQIRNYVMEWCHHKKMSK